MPDGRLCQASALRGQRYCYMHDPDNAEQAAESRRVGGLRRRREGTLAGAYAITGVRTTDELLRVVEIAVFDLLGLDNSISRARALLYAAMVGAKLRETGEHEERIVALEGVINRRRLDDALTGDGL